MPIRHLLLALGLCLAVPVQAEVRHDLADLSLAATVDGAPFSNRLVDVMHRIARQGDASITRAAVVQALVDDRLAAAYARATVTGEPLIEDNKVAFSPAMQIQQALVSNIQVAFREQLQAQLKREKGGNLDGVILGERVPTTAEWDAVLGRKPGLLLEYSLDARSRSAAARVVLLRYRFGKEAPGRISLLDVYDAQNVQGRNQLHARGDAFATEQARLLLMQRYVMAWARSSRGLGEADFAVLRRALEDHLVHGGWMAILGVAADIHDDPQHLKDLQAGVTADEIRAYYDENRDEFSRIEKVKARHIRLKDEATANSVEARLRGGESVEALAKQFSAAPDAASGGDLGWILHDKQSLGWLDSLAFLQKPGVLSKPVRLPGAAGEEPGWEILVVEERVMGWHPVDSDTSRYIASQAIAKRKALAEYQGTLARLRREADIRLHPDFSPLARPQERK